MTQLFGIAVALVFGLDPIAPMPDIWQSGNSTVLDLSSPIQIVVADDVTKDELGGVKTLVNVFDLKAKIVKASDFKSGTALYIGEHSRNSSLNSSAIASKLKSLSPAGKEGYRIIVDSDGIILAGTDALGTRNGLNYLAGILGETLALPQLSIQDEPDMPLRIISPFSMNALPRSLAYRPNSVLFPITESQWSNPSRIERQAVDYRSVGLEPITTVDFAVRPNEELAHVLMAIKGKYLLLSRKENGEWPECTSNHSRLSQCVKKHVDEWFGFVSASLPGVRLLIDADTFMPFSDGGLAGADDAIRGLPDGTWLYVEQNGEGVTTTIQWLENQKYPFVLVASPNPDMTPDVQRARIVHLLDFANENPDRCKGIGVLRTPVDATVLRHAWKMDSYIPLWPAALNEVFGSDLGQPGPDDVMKALITYVNSNLLAGATPDEINDQVAKRLSKTSIENPTHAEDINRLEKLNQYITEYIHLEKRYVDDPTDEVFVDLVDFVKRWGAQTQWPKQRTKIIVETIGEKKLMVPASIMFGHYVMPFRPGIALTSGTLLPLPATTTENLQENYSEMKLRTGALPIAPIRRFDFETVGGASILIENSDDGDRYRTAHFETTKITGGMRAPILLEETFLTPWWTFKVNAPYEQSHIRNFQTLAWKPPARIKVETKDSPIKIDGRLDEPAWKMDPQVFGFVDNFGEAFSTTPSTIKLVSQNESLYIAAETTTESNRDELSILIRPPSGKTFRIRLQLSKKDTAILFTRNGLPIKGFAEASLRPQGDIWVSEIRIPLANLEATEAIGRWNFNAVHLSQDEEIRSIWAPVTSSTTPLVDFGTLTF